METKNLVCLVYDFGYYLPIAQKLAESFKKVYYYTPSINAGFPVHSQYYVGQNIDGIECTEDWSNHFEECDLFIFPDVYDQGIQELLRRLGKKVFGGGRGGELEVDRIALKELLADLDLDVCDYKVVKGIDDLRKLLKKKDELWVKSSMRGNMETWGHHTYETSKKELDRLQCSLGASANQEEYIVEESITDAVEYGADMFVINGQYAELGTIGIEIKGMCYVCKLTPLSEFPEGLKNINDKFSKPLSDLKYKGAFSNEVRVTKDGKNYLGDICSRFGNPPAPVWLEMIDNFAEVCYMVASGVVPEIKIKHKFGVQVSIISSSAKHTSVPIIIPKKYQDYVKIINCMIDEEGTLCYIPQREERDDVLIGNVVGVGSTITEAIEHCKKVAESVKGFDIDIPVSNLDNAIEEIAKLKKFGIELF